MEFVGFPKIARLSRDIIITEKLDGTNAQILIEPNGTIFAASRTRYVTPESDNYGFAGWVQRNAEDLLNLGIGRHFGEWYGNGINRNYGLKEKRFALFNTLRWADKAIPTCCELAPVLYTGPFDTKVIDIALHNLAQFGSVAVPGYMKPEGIIIYHVAANVMFKKTIDGDGHPKSLLGR